MPCCQEKHDLSPEQCPAVNAKRSELPLQSELGNPGFVGCLELGKCRRKQDVVGIPEIHLIEQIEDLTAKLESRSFPERETLCNP